MFRAFGCSALLALVFASVALAVHGPVGFTFPGAYAGSGTVPAGQWAMFSGTVNSGTKELYVYITHNVPDVSLLHIHANLTTPATALGVQVGSAAPIITIAASASEAVSPIRKRFVLTDAELGSICGKVAYFNLHSDSNPNGHFAAVIYLDCPNRTLPFMFTGIGSTPSLVESINFTGHYNPGSRVFYVEIAHAVVGITAIHIHSPTTNEYTAPGSPYLQTAGIGQDIILSTTDSTSPIQRAYILDSATHNAVCGRKAYFNVHTTAVAGGAYGAVVWIDCNPRLTFNIPGAALSAVSEPCIFAGTLDFDQMWLSLYVTHNLAGDQTLMHIHGVVSPPFTAPGPIGTPAGVLQGLGNGATDLASPFMRVIQLSSSVMFNMCKNLTYFAIHSGAAPGGAYVGANTLFCYRPGALAFSYTAFGVDSTQNLLPTITGNFNVETRQLQVNMDLSMLTGVTGVHLHGPNPTAFSGPGNPFSNGASAGILIVYASGSIGSIDQVLTVNAVNASAICGRRTYFAIHTTTFIGGAYGAILDVNCFGDSTAVQAPAAQPPSNQPPGTQPAIAPAVLVPTPSIIIEEEEGTLAVVSLATLVAALAVALF